MKRRYRRAGMKVFAGMLLLGLCFGCGQRDDAQQESEELAYESDAEPAEDLQEKEASTAKEQASSEMPEEQKVSEEPASDSVATDSGGTLPGDAEGKTDTVQEKLSPDAEEGQSGKKELDVPENGRRLTAEELAEYTEWIQDLSNYGFLLSDWEDPSQILLYQVFYNGAGVAREGTEEEKRAYMERNDQPEIYTDFFAMDKADVDAVLSEKVGFTYDELVEKGSRGMEDAYYAESDSFCLEHGDTNYTLFRCTDGTIDEDGTTVTLYCEGNNWVNLCEVKVGLASGQRRFLSSHIVEGSMLEDYEEWYDGWYGET